MKSVFGESGEIDVVKIVQQASPFRTFYYGCMDDVQKDGEDDDTFKARIETQDAYFDYIRSVYGVHRQLGTLAGRRRGKKERRQKEVDVLLAVGMLTHGFNKNMSRAVLLSGDLDFRPVVEALVRGASLSKSRVRRRQVQKTCTGLGIGRFRLIGNRSTGGAVSPFCRSTHCRCR